MLHVLFRDRVTAICSELYVLNYLSGVNAKEFILLSPQYCGLQNALDLIGDSERTETMVNNPEKHTLVLI